MTSKAENTSHNLHQQHRLNIFFRNPTLLKIVAWLGSLSFLGSAGIVWADLKPISASNSEAQAIAQVSLADRHHAVEPQNREVFGPQIPASWRQSPAQIVATAYAHVDELPNREVPIAVAPASATIAPSGKIVRPQHADLLAADNYTVSVNGSAPKQILADAAISLPASISHRQTGEIVTNTSSQVQPGSARQRMAISLSVPATSLNSQSQSTHSPTGYRAVPKVPSLSPGRSTPQQIGKGGISTPTTPVAISLHKGSPNHSNLAQSGQRPGLKPAIVTPMKPATTTARAKLPQTERQNIAASLPSGLKTNLAPDRTLGASPQIIPSAATQPELSIAINVPPPRTQMIQVQPVAQLPQITRRAVPVVAALPIVRTATAAVQSKPIAFINTGANESSDLIYPLSNPAPITSNFGWRTHPISGSRRFHSGVDIGAPMGAPVVAAGSGTIISAGWVGGYGKAIIIQHNGVQQTLYGHLSEVFVQPGQRIEQGTVIGRVGSTGNSTGPHLHFETRMSTADGWIATDPGDGVKYALDNLRRAMPIAKRDLPPGIN